MRARDDGALQRVPSSRRSSRRKRPRSTSHRADGSSSASAPAGTSASSRLSGLPFPRAGVRLARLGESVEILQAAVLRRGGVVRRDALPRWTRWCRAASDAASAPDDLGRRQGRPGDADDRVGRATAGTLHGSRTSMPYLERAALLGDAPVKRSIGQYAQGSAQEMIDRLAAFARAGVEHAVMCFSTVPVRSRRPRRRSRASRKTCFRIRGACRR